MGKSTFDEKQLEVLLKNMPSVKDQQDPEQLFARISSRLQEDETVESTDSTNTVPRKKKSWILPTIASLAAVLIIALVAPSFLYNQQSSMENSEVDRSNDNQSQAILEADEPEEQFGIMSSEENIGMLRMAPIESNVINEVSEHEEILTVAIPDNNAQFVIPISFLVPKDERSKLEKIETIQAQLREDEWGLSSYILDNISLEEELEGEVKKVIIDVPANHPYGNGSAMETIFIATIKTMFKQLDYDVVEFQTEGKPGIMLGNYGELTEISLADSDEKQAYFVFQPFESNNTYLVPFPGASDFSQALELMRKPVELDLNQIRPSISENIIFEKITKDNQTVTIEFNPNTIFDQGMNDILMIEAILMTAKEFDFTAVEFKNAPLDYVGPYSLTESIQVPKAVNPMPYIDTTP